MLHTHCTSLLFKHRLLTTVPVKLVIDKTYLWVESKRGGLKMKGKFEHHSSSQAAAQFIQRNKRSRNISKPLKGNNKYLCI